MNNHNNGRHSRIDPEPWVTKLTSMSYAHLALLYAGMILGFGLLYFALSQWLPRHAPSIPYGAAIWLKLLDSMYFSTITATSVGYGDISPHGISKVLAGIQSISSLFVFAILVSKPISHRQEAALYQMHQLSFDDIFTSVREGFFIMRKDFDELISRIKRGEKMEQHSWENLIIAYQQGEVLIEEIPKFYDTEKKLYVIDMHREGLLQESVERTLERLLTLLQTFDGDAVPWRTHEKSLSQLDDFLVLAEETIEHWQMQSPHPATEGFVHLLDLSAEIRSLRHKGVN